ncbi:MAG: S8 family peptidase, partial [Candidatus Xenobia bacterium]
MSKRTVAWVLGSLALFMLWQLMTPQRPKPAVVVPISDACAAGPGIPDTVETVPGELLLDARQADWPQLQQDLHRLAPQAEVEKVSRFDDEIMVTLRVPDDQVDSTVAALEQDARVEDAEPDYVMHAYNGPDDPLYKYQWNMRKVGAEKAWRVSTGKGVVVAVIDTGVAYEEYGDKFHRCEDFKPETFVPGHNFCNNSPHANDDHAHGTHVAGTIAEATNNGIGAVGLAPDAKIMPVKVLSANGGGSIGNIADGIRWAADHGADVINMSLGGPFGPPALRKACSYAAKRHVVIVCASGNNKSTNVGYPAAFPECIAVSAVRDDNTLTFYSNRGKRIDIAAPGGDLQVDQNEDGYPDGILQNTIEPMHPEKQGYYQFQGTSMASPHVAAAAALLEELGVNQPEAV